MTKQKELKNLTWKYFWQQKKEEIFIWWDDSGLGITFVTFFGGLLLQLGWAKEVGSDVPECKVAAIIGLFLLGFAILIGIINLIRTICKWIKSNWEKASARAKKDLKKARKGGRKK